MDEPIEIAPDWQPQHGFYLTVGRADDGRLIAVLSDGSPQFGHDPVTVLSVHPVKTMKEARTWFRKQRAEQPWVTRQ